MLFFYSPCDYSQAFSILLCVCEKRWGKSSINARAQSNATSRDFRFYIWITHVWWVYANTHANKHINVKEVLCDQEWSVDFRLGKYLNWALCNDANRQYTNALCLQNCPGIDECVLNINGWLVMPLVAQGLMFLLRVCGCCVVCMDLFLYFRFMLSLQ